MIEGGWPYVWASYALTVTVVGALALTVTFRLRHWSKRARALDAARQSEKAA